MKYQLHQMHANMEAVKWLHRPQAHFTLFCHWGQVSFQTSTFKKRVLLSDFLGATAWNLHLQGREGGWISSCKILCQITAILGELYFQTLQSLSWRQSSILPPWLWSQLLFWCIGWETQAKMGGHTVPAVGSWSNLGFLSVICPAAL